MTKISNTTIRAPISHIPIETCTRLLTTSPKMSNKSRKLFMQARGNKIDVERQEPKAVQEKYCAKLRTLKQVYTLQLYRHGWIEQEYRHRTRRTAAQIQADNSVEVNAI